MEHKEICLSLSLETATEALRTGKRFAAPQYSFRMPFRSPFLLCVRALNLVSQNYPPLNLQFFCFVFFCCGSALCTRMFHHGRVRNNLISFILRLCLSTTYSVNSSPFIVSCRHNSLLSRNSNAMMSSRFKNLDTFFVESSDLTQFS